MLCQVRICTLFIFDLSILHYASDDLGIVLGLFVFPIGAVLDREQHLTHWRANRPRYRSSSSTNTLNFVYTFLSIGAVLELGTALLHCQYFIICRVLNTSVLTFLTLYYLLQNPSRIYSALGRCVFT
jgi:hypothetical protein